METVPASGMTADPAPPPPLRPAAGLDHPIVISVRGLRKEYLTGRGRLVLFEDLAFDIFEGEMLAIVGQSGAGKSTLYTCWAPLIPPRRVTYTAPQLI